MKIVQGDEVPLVRGLEYRGGMFHSRRLLEGTPGTIDNFQLGVGVSQGDFYSPRHRHNFEQIRVQLDGALSYDRDGTMTAGIVGYFPEGVFYGPQSQKPEDVATAAVLQFGGASGSGYLSNKETRAAMEELNKLGEFKDGVFRRREAFHGKKNADGNQAIWEHHHQRPIAFPKPRYPEPIMMDPKNFAWVPVAGAPGASEKLLGVFTERRTEASLYKLDPGASLTVKGNGVFLALRGAGKVGDAPLRKLTAFHLARGETVKVTASEETEIMHFGLPNLDGVTMGIPEELTAEAAE
ncbi:MAG: hypothetical protein ACXWJW_02670 [Xanthobacteraceae bacterium]